jgi:glycosyltransferase involved in cell wall biosynthesis
MAGKISVVINTLNEAEQLEKALESLKWADEVLVCDMHSDDGTLGVAKKFNAKVITHKRMNFVEPARNFAISKAAHDWVLIIDPDEEIPNSLASRLKEIVDKSMSDFVEIPRKNIIFGKWVNGSMWWPDYNIRFFKKGKVSWAGINIHRPPKTEGQGLKLEEKEELAITHNHYATISQFIRRLDRYTDVQAKEIIKSGYKFNWKDLITKPLGEFLGRFFANRGFEDGLHGLVLSLLQSFSFLVMYLKVWELEKFKQEDITLTEVKQITKNGGKEINYWFKYASLSKNPVKRFVQKIGNRLL